MSMKCRRILVTLSISASLLTVTPAISQGGEVVIPGKVVTGFNRYLGQPYADFGNPLRQAGFSTLGRFNNGGANPLPLTPQTPDDALLATVVDPAFWNLVGLNPRPVDPALVNVPLRQVATNVGFDGQTRFPLPGSGDAQFIEFSQREPADPIDLATWNRARGVVSVTCDEGGASQIGLAARNLLPNRLYSVWGLIDVPNFGVQWHAVGGLPNVLVTDDKGQGTFNCALNSCPLSSAPNEPELLALDLMYHSDHMLNGAHPSVPMAGGGLAVGAISHAHLEFIFEGQELLEPEGWGDSGDCLPSRTTHCFGDGRFQAEIEWTDFAGKSGQARTSGFDSDDSGSFYFFSRDNTEALVKVLDGCDFNQHFWVFASMATDVEYTLTVTDTQTRQSRTYGNELGQRSPAVTDTSAFATCP